MADGRVVSAFWGGCKNPDGSGKRAKLPPDEALINTLTSGHLLTFTDGFHRNLNFAKIDARAYVGWCGHMGECQNTNILM